MEFNNVKKIFTDRKHFEIFILGGYSGIPLYMIYSTLSAWLKTSNVTIEIITTFALARIFYSLKFLWAPLIDHFKIPILHRMGRRKSWMIFIMAIIVIINLIYSTIDPSLSIGMAFWLTICLGVASASLDIVIDAYRIDNIEKEQLAIAAANAVFGYRVGGLIIGAGALFAAEEYGWPVVFWTIAAVYSLGMLFVANLTEITVTISKKFDKEYWKNIVIMPFVDFFKRQYAVTILLAIIFFKLGDAMLGVVATPFYIDLGFSLKEISAIVKLFGFGATILGCYIGGAITFKYGYLRGMIFCGIMQSVTNLSFIWLKAKGHDPNALMIAISIENVASGMGDTALIGFLSYLCNKQFSATQYALLSSCSGLFSHTIVSTGGSILKYIGWVPYFLMTTILAFPGICWFVYLSSKIKDKF